MRAHVVENGKIINTVEVDSLDFIPGLVEAVGEEGIGWGYDGKAFFENLQEEAVIAEQTRTRIKSLILEAVQNRLDTFAKTRNYDNILSACTYATDIDATFSAEGQYCVAARGATWRKLYEILDEVNTGIRPEPTCYADIEPELPALNWPDWI